MDALVSHPAVTHVDWCLIASEARLPAWKWFYSFMVLNDMVMPAEVSQVFVTVFLDCPIDELIEQVRCAWHKVYSGWTTAF